VAGAVNSELGWLYWQVGRRIREEILRGDRAEYGKQIFHTLCGKLSWSHIRQIIYLEDPLAREFYVELARMERWSVRTLLERKLHEAMAIARRRLAAGRG
jgi:hypothetical protein